MRFRELLTLLPCSSWEELPADREGQEAEELLTAWSALWHPLLLANAGSAPTWYPASAPPETAADRLVVIPQASQGALPADWTEHARTSGVVLRGMACRTEMVATALRHLDGGQRPVEPDLVADFLALGYGYLMVELLTQTMHSSSYLDQGRFDQLLTEAAVAAVRADTTAAREGLAGLFNLLLAARDHFYPVDAYLVDLTLLAGSTLGRPLRDELAAAARFDSPVNLVVAGEVVAQMAAREPESLRAVRQRLESGAISVVGGAYSEQAPPPWVPESLLTSLARGRGAYQQYLGRPATVYGGRHAGLSPLLPQVLDRFGFRGVLHLALDGTPVPRAKQCKMRWQGLDGSTIDALAVTPLDADKPESFLGFSQRMSGSMDRDYVATVCFAHWPGRARPWYEDLRRIANYGPVLGKFVTLDDYFSTTEPPDLLSRFAADQYQSNCLLGDDAAQAKDPISRHVREYRRQAESFAGATAAAMAAMATEVSPANAPGLEGSLQRLAQCVASGATAAPRGRLAVNPFSHPRTVCCPPAPADGGPAAAVPVTAECDDGSAVAVPGLGFAWFGPWAEPASRPGRSAAAALPALAAGHVLKNEYLEVKINPVTGAVQAIHDYGCRGNRLSQQIALRYRRRPDDSRPMQQRPDHPTYSRMLAESVEVTAPGPTHGGITSRGWIVQDNGKRLAGFVQTVRLARGGRLVRIDIQLAPLHLPNAAPWESYYAARFAWPDEDAEIAYSTGMTRQATRNRRIEAAHYVEVKSAHQSLVILPGGHPFHRRSGARMLDTLLLVRGETARRFALGVALGAVHPMPAAWDFIVPQERLSVVAYRPLPAAGWLLHVGARNVMLTHLGPLCGDHGSVAAATVAAGSPVGASAARKRVVGFRMRLLETEGRAGRARIRSFRAVRAAEQTDFLGQTRATLGLEDGRIVVDLNPYQWVQVEALWV